MLGTETYASFSMRSPKPSLFAQKNDLNFLLYLKLSLPQRLHNSIFSLRVTAQKNMI
jgi:hypothetical protein